MRTIITKNEINQISVQCRLREKVSMNVVKESKKQLKEVAKFQTGFNGNLKYCF